MRRFLWSLIPLCLLCPVESHALDLSVKRTDDGNWYIVAAGEIATGDDFLFRAIADTMPEGTAVIWNSPGGSVETSLSIGRKARSKKMMSVVDPYGSCLSACLFAFSGGVTRDVPKTAKLGSHQFRWSGEASAGDVTITQKLSASILRYTTEMGIDAEALTFILDTPPEEMFVFSRSALRGYHLISPIEHHDISPRCIETAFRNENEQNCRAMTEWIDVVVPEFLADHPEYQKGGDKYRLLDREIRRLQSNSASSLDPVLLLHAHKNVSGALTR